MRGAPALVYFRMRGGQSKKSASSPSLQLYSETLEVSSCFAKNIKIFEGFMVRGAGLMDRIPLLAPTFVELIIHGGKQVVCK